MAPQDDARWASEFVRRPVASVAPPDGRDEAAPTVRLGQDLLGDSFRLLKRPECPHSVRGSKIGLDIRQMRTQVVVRAHERRAIGVHQRERRLDLRDVIQRQRSAYLR